MSRALTVGLLLAVIAALALRCPQLAIRPMHNDEGVNATKLRALWERGAYKYDPNEYHGPALFYAAWAWMKLIGASGFTNWSETQLRSLMVVFGVGLILLLPLIADGLGSRTTACAAVLMAISPAMVFYGRYFIHEMLLVFFTLLALAAGWRYTQNRKLGWALLAGAAVGLMQATKETFVLTMAAVAVAWVLNGIWNRLAASEKTPLKYNCRHIIAAMAAWLVVFVVMFSSFFSNFDGLANAVRTYLPWLQRAGDASTHFHPWDFYLTRLIFFRSGNGPIWSEGLIAMLATIGMVAAFGRQNLTEGDQRFVRFIAIYSVVLTIIYSAIGYKTPWCLLSFWNGIVLMAGVGAVALWHWLRQPSAKIAVGIILMAGAAQLAFQAWQSGITFAADSRNPYVYAQTSPDILNLVARLDAIAQAHPQKNLMVIKIMAPENDYGPLPWYLRRFGQTGWWSEVPVDPFAPVMIVSTKFHAELDAKKTHLMVGLFELRPQNFFELYVEKNLWRVYLDTKPAN